MRMSRHCDGPRRRGRRHGGCGPDAQTARGRRRAGVRHGGNDAHPDARGRGTPGLPDRARGYVLWGVPGAAVGRQLQQQRADYEYRLAEQAQRLKAAEERARLETETRKVLEEELHRLFPRS
jgi:hypothetical protein